MTDRTCATCAWWKKGNKPSYQKTEEYGTCRYNPPLCGGPAGESNWPGVLEDDWCRHHTTTRGWEDEAQPDERTWKEELIRLAGDWAKEADRLNNEVQRLRKRQQEAAQLFIELGTDVELDAFPVAADWEKRRLAWIAGMTQEDKGDK